MSLSLTSPTFTQGGPIPRSCTCDGPDTAPALDWAGAPPGTKSFALIVDDPDAPDPAKPQRVYVHWVLYNIPATVAGLAAGVTDATLPSGIEGGKNDWDRLGYGGPCPPIGRHRYFFKLYALDAVLAGLNQPTKNELLAAMEGHILAQTELMGTYERSK